MNRVAEENLDHKKLDKLERGYVRLGRSAGDARQLRKQREAELKQNIAERNARIAKIEESAAWVNENAGESILDPNLLDDTSDLYDDIQWARNTDLALKEAGWTVASATGVGAVVRFGRFLRATRAARVGSKTARGAESTRLGVVRNNPADWRATRDLWDATGYGDILSAGNRAAIARGRTPVVDEAWIRHFPEDAGLLGERIPIHHIQGTPITTPLPATRHLDAHMPGGFRYNPGGPGGQVPIYAEPPN